MGIAPHKRTTEQRSQMRLFQQTVNECGGFMGSIGMPELLVILLIVLLLFGGGKVKDIGKGLGEGIREFKKALNGADDKKKDGSKKDAG